MSDVYDCADETARADGIAAAGRAVRSGEVVVLPTDTVYGIGCDAFDPAGVAAVLAAKGRGRDKPPPVLIPAARTALGLATDIPDYAIALMERFWPGPLTVVLRAHPSLHWDLGETNGTVALRVPDHPVALELLADVGPMAVTSANTTGDPAARTAQAAQVMLGETVTVYLDAGPASDGEPSTIIDCTGAAPVTLRVGALSQEQIEAALAPEAAVAEPAVTEPAVAEPVVMEPAEQPAAEPADHRGEGVGPEPEGVEENASR
jgi:tRNA threonylcarbamoyl adenosine modification protein (Sua5/YciO/YrdC/YwlC family)